jgi:Ca2+-binding EF-hand superfamily protein
MRNRLWLALALAWLCGLPRVAQADDIPAPDLNDPTVRILVCTPQGPIIVQLSLTIDGRPYRQAAEKVLDDQFALVAEDPAWGAVFEKKTGLLGGRFMSARTPQQRASVIASYDRDRDGLISRGELRAPLLIQNDGQTLTLTEQAFGVGPDEQLWLLIDIDGDWRLSARELRQAAARIAAADISGDGVLELSELQRAVRRKMQPATLGVLLGTPDSATPAARALQAHYADAQGVIARRSFRIAPSVFDQLDANADGLLQEAELPRIAALPPHITLAMDHTDSDTDGAVRNPSIQTVSELPETRKDPREDALYSWQMGPGQVQIHGVTQTAKKLSKRWASNVVTHRNRGSVEPERTVTGPNGTPMTIRSSTDGLFLLDAPISRCWMRIVLVRSLPPIWEKFDANHDSRFGARDIRSFLKLLADCDTDADGEVSYDEAPFEMGIGVGRGAILDPVLVGSPRQESSPPLPPPTWFTRMDTNRDRDVTPREFLGTTEQFERIDADHDGLIDPREAAAAKP